MDFGPPFFYDDVQFGPLTHSYILVRYFSPLALTVHESLTHMMPFGSFSKRAS